MSETNAERLARVFNAQIRGDLGGPDEVELQSILQNDFLLVPSDAQRLIDILASWRTCGQCQHWTREEGVHREFGACWDAVGGMSDTDGITTPQGFTCGSWEERKP